MAPDDITNIFVDSATGQKMDIRWGTPFHGGSPLMTYSINVTTISQTGEYLYKN